MNYTNADAARFWAKVEKTDSCWNWLGWRDTAGYGGFDLNHQHQRAHRVSYVLAGLPLIDGLVLDHLCRNRGCVNPEHLDQVTERENILRGISGSAINARKTHCIEGHELTGANLYMDMSCRAPKRKCRACMSEASKRYRARKQQTVHA